MPATDVLRERTAAAHAALDRSDLIRPALRERTRFRHLVGAMLAFHRVVEREVARFAGPLAGYGIDVARYAKGDLLAADALALASVPCPEPAYALASYGEAAGAIYVLEGSTLGGALLAADLRHNTGFESRYYGCYGRETAARWRETSERLDRVGVDSSTLDEMVAGAQRTFATLQDHLSNHPSRTYALLDSDGIVRLYPTKGLLGGYRRGTYRLYGRLDCASALRHIARGHYAEHRVFFKDEATAIAAGHRPCAKCMPIEYALWKSTARADNPG